MLVRDRWLATVNEHSIEVETHARSIWTFIASLFVDHERVDHVTYAALKSEFSLRTRISTPPSDYVVRVELRHGMLGTRAVLYVNGAEIAFPRVE